MKPKTTTRSNLVVQRGSTLYPRISVSTPGKLMLLGEHAVVYGHPCIVTAIDQRLHLTAELTTEPIFTLNAPEVKIKNYKKPISQLGKGTVPPGTKFIELATRIATRSNLVVQQGSTLFRGVKISTHSDFSSQYGLGSSSASTVCTIFALCKLMGIQLTQKQLFDLAYKTVVEIQGKASGFDIAAAIWGGTLYFVKPNLSSTHSLLSSTHSLLSSPRKRGSRDWIPYRPAAKRGPHGTVYRIGNDKKASLPLIVAYSGSKAKTTDLIAKVADLKQKYPDLVQKTFDSVENIVKNGKKVIKNGDLQTLGELFNLNQGYLETLGVSSSKLSTMIYAAREAGAYGAKLSGAGGGDCIIALAPPSKIKQVEKAITKSGGKIIHVKTNAQGVNIES